MCSSGGQELKTDDRRTTNSSTSGQGALPDRSCFLEPPFNSLAQQSCGGGGQQASVAWATLPFLVAFTHVVQEDVVLERVGDEPLGAAVLSAVLQPVLLLGKLEKLLRRDGVRGGDHQQACRTWT